MPVTLTEPTRRRPPGARRAALLRLLSEYDEGLAVSELAPLAGLHPNTVRTHLDLLVRSGSVVRRTESRSTPGRPREIYRATGAAADDRNYQLLARMLAGRLAELTDDPAQEAAEAGRRWSQRDADRVPAPTATATSTEPAGPHATLAPVIRMLRDAGFAPELSADASTIELHHCPFRELAAEQPEIVCSAHLGLIQGALERIGPEVAATRILPFVQPNLCRAQLTHRR